MTFLKYILKEGWQKKVHRFFSLVLYLFRIDHLLKNGGIVEIGTELRIIYTLAIAIFVGN
jgi:hypothetical protein